MKKLWFGLFAFVLSVCCGFALLHGSYTSSNLIAHSNAYTFYDVNSSDDSPYWELTDISVPEGWDSKMVVSYNGHAYCFIADDDDNGITSINVIDYYNGTFTDRSVSVASGFYFSDVAYDNNDYLRISNVVYYNFVPYIYCDGTYYSFDGSVLGAQHFSVDTGSTFNVNNYDNIFYVNGTDFNGTESLIWGCDDANYYYFLNGTDLYLYSCYNDQDVPCFVRVSADGTITLINENDEGTYMGYTYTWSDGKYAYYDNGSTHMIFDTSTNLWISHSWTGYTGSFSRQNVWSDGNNIYMTANGTTYMLHIEHPYVSPYPNVLSELIALMTGGIAGIAEGIGENLSVLAESVMIDSATGNLSAFGSLVVIMAGLALALHLCRWVVNFVTSLGRRDR